MQALIYSVTRLASAAGDHVRILSALAARNHRIMAFQTSNTRSSQNLLITGSLSILILIIKVEYLLYDIRRNITDLLLIIFLNSAATAALAYLREIALLH